MDLQHLNSQKEASWWVWDQLWSPEQSSYVTYDILDVIRFNQTQIISWLFTMIDNKIKSKSKSRWNLASITSRCTNSNGELCGHILKGNIWEYLPSDTINIDNQTSTIISTAQINHPYLLLDVVFEKQTGILAPKVICYRLCDSSVLGKTIIDKDNSLNSNYKLFPTQRLLFTNKNLNEILKEKILLLINILEFKSKSNIQKISCVYIVEDYKNCATNPDYKIKLHHTNEIILQKKKVTVPTTTSSLSKSNSCILSESGYSEVSEMTTTSRGYIHKFKCEGDFCLFNSEEEGAQLQLSEELEFNITRERKQAIQRNKRLPHDHHKNKNNEEEEEEEEDENHEIYRSTVLAATSNPTVEMSNKGGSALKPNTTNSYKISMKSIYLARNEMKMLDTYVQNHPNSPTKPSNLPVELQHWSPLLLSWYYRIGRSVIQKYSQPIVPIPVSAGHIISKSLLATSSTSPERHPSEEDSSKELKSPSLTSSTLQQHTTSMNTFSSNNSHHKNELSQLIPYDLNENSYHPNRNPTDPITATAASTSSSSSAKHLGRYYSSTIVCERCYHIYKELNRLRKYQLNLLLKNKKIEEKEEKLQLRDENSSSYLTHKMNQMNQFANQRITTYRLAKSKYPPPLNILEERLGGGGAGAGGGASGSGGGGGAGSAPKGVLPPLPWQLRHDDKRQEYEQQGSAFIKNIQNKTQKIIEITAKKNEEFYHHQGSQEEINLDAHYDWKKTLIARSSPPPPYPNETINSLQKSNSAGGTSRRVSKRKEKETKKIKKFNHERLLHPYQRYFEQMKREENMKNNAKKVDEDVFQAQQSMTNTTTTNNNKTTTSTRNSDGNSNSSQLLGSSINHSHHPQSLGKKGKSFSTSLLPVFETEEPQYLSSSKSQNTTSLLPPLVPRQQHSSSPSKKFPSSTITSPQKRFQTKAEVDSDEEDGDDEDEEGIGWSPFVVPP